MTEKQIFGVRLIDTDEEYQIPLDKELKEEYAISLAEELY